MGFTRARQGMKCPHGSSGIFRRLALYAGMDLKAQRNVCRDKADRVFSGTRQCAAARGGQAKSTISYVNNRAEMIDRLKATEPQLRAHGVAGLYLFGSYTRDE